MEILKRHGVQIKKLIVVISIVLFIAAPFVSYAHRNTDPTFITRDESPMEGSIGYTIHRTPHSPQTSVVVYNGSVNDQSADWYPRWSIFCEIHNESQGVLIDLAGTGTTTWGATLDSSVEFIGSPTLPLMNYSEVCFMIEIKAIHGSANVSLKMNYDLWPDSDWAEGGENSTFFTEGQSGVVILKPSLSGAYDLCSGWVIRTIMMLEITSSEESLVRVGDVSISVVSNENLYPVTFDLQAPDGESLFLNPYMQALRFEDYLYYDNDYPRYPAVELKRTGNITDSSVFSPRITNETLYLAEGSYEGVAGWFYGEYQMQDSILNTSFTIGPDESVHIGIRIPTFRLYIEIAPSFAYSKVTVRDFGYIYRIEYPIQGAEYLYMPNRTSISITVSPIAYLYNRDVDYAHFNYRQATARISVLTDGASCVRVSVVFSQFSLFGIIFDWGQILGILGTTLLLLLLIHGGIKKSFAGARKDFNLRTNILPVSLYYITMFFPWVTYSFNTDGNPFTIVSGVVMIPLCTTLWWSSQSQLTPAPSSYLLPNIIVILIFYWIPMIYLSYLIATRTNSISDELFHNEEGSFLSLGILGSPFIIGCYYAWLCIIGLCYLNIGLIAAVLTLPSWGVVSWLKKRNNRAHANHVNS
ncbi:MAG: hypothetical protein AM326_05705 [Candidatus Thorarchaeota archaeon SMTZ-45]|nr:MAG: hypothetical protein AM325_09335 [Candidatus Thorarchaeota archaeon SMTZ1-45]KXH77120.1 MAG: hypothetical protein AM326_05705 [Candidatus Thorarchaeota archaeon SMTZ-45]